MSSQPPLRSAGRWNAGRQAALFESLEPRMLMAAAPVVSIAAIDAAASENGDAGQFVITRDAPAATPLKVKLTPKGTARNGTDYVKIPTTVTIPANAVSVTVTLTPIDDSKVEPAETVLLGLAASSAYTIDAGAASGTVAIADATYLAADFFPLDDGARWDYLVTENGRRESWYTEMEDQGATTRMWFNRYDQDGSSSQWYKTLSNAGGDVLVVGEHGAEGNTIAWTPGELWFPDSMTIGLKYAFTTDRSEDGEDGTVVGTIHVAKLETVKTPAGTFKALKIVSTTRDTMPGSVDQETLTFWLVRGVGIVKITDVGRGSDGDRWNTTLQMTSYSLSSDWTAQQAMNSVRNQFASGVVDGKVYVFGGNGVAGANLASTEVYNPATDTWTDLADNPNNAGEGVEELTGVGLGGKFYVFGAWGGTGPGGYYGVFNFNQAYDPATDTWTSLAPKPTPVASAPCVVYNGEIYVFGGYFSYEDSRGREHKTRYNVVEAYNPATNTWRVVTRMPKVLGGEAIAVVGDKAYLMGGYTGNYKLSSLTMAFDFTTATWTTKGLAAMPNPRISNSYSGPAPVYNGSIYIVGGCQGTPAGAWATNLVDIYDVASNTWSTGPALPKPVEAHTCAIADDTLYVVGGNAFPMVEDDVVSDVWAISLL